MGGMAQPTPQPVPFTCAAGCADSVRCMHLQDLMQYSLSARGLSSCGIDPMASPGTTFVVDFWVWDGSKANATVSRYITITDPCPANDSATYEFCHDPADDRCGRLFLHCKNLATLSRGRILLALALSRNQLHLDHTGGAV
jgi:hypothetical protein